MKSGLQRRIVILFLAFGLFPLFLSAFLLNALSRAFFSREAESRLATLADLMAVRIESDLRSHWRELDLMRHFLSRPELTLEEKRAFLTEELEGRRSIYSWYGLTDGKGRVVEGKWEEDRGRDLSARRWHLEAREGKALMVDSPPPIRRPESLSVGFTAAALGPGGEFLGALRLERDVKDLVAGFHPLGMDPGVNVYLLDAFGNVLSDRLSEKRGDMFFNVSRWPVYRELRRREGGGMAGDDGAGSAVFAAMTRLTSNPFGPALGWSVMTVQPMDSVFSSLGLQTRVIAVFLFGGVLMTSLLTLLIARGITGPARALSLAAQAIAQGDYDSRVQVRRKDEIGDLAESFNRMVESLSRYRDEVERRTNDIIALKELNEGIIRSAPVGIAAVRSDGAIASMNPAFKSLFGLTDRDVGRSLADLSFLKGTPMEALAREKNFQERFERQDMPVTLESGEKRWATWIGAPMRAAAGLPEHTFVLAIDKTRQIEMEENMRKTRENLIRADRLATVGQLAAGVSHEINNPIGIIMGFSQELLEELEEDNPIRGDLEHIHRAAEQCKKVVAGLLQFARPMDSDLEKVDLNRLLGNLLDSVEPQRIFKEIAVERNFEEGLAPVWGSEGMFRQVFMNLIVNAAQAIGGAGRFVVSTRKIPGQYEGDGGGLEVAFEDDGCGIPEENLKKIFDPFFTTKDPGKGTGLGLSISYGIVKKFHGNIDVQSAEGKGTRFVIRLPYLDSADG